MSSNSIDIKDLKKMRLERHWSQEQLAEMSGLSIRTIQRIENGENAGLETLKALAAVFETNINNSDKKSDMEQVRKEEEYIQKLKGFYKLLALAIVNLAIFLFIAIADSDTDSEGWWVFLYMVITWVVILGAYSLNSFDFFGEEWKRKMIEKKFKKKS